MPASWEPVTAPVTLSASTQPVEYRMGEPDPAVSPQQRNLTQLISGLRRGGTARAEKCCYPELTPPGRVRRIGAQHIGRAAVPVAPPKETQEGGPTMRTIASERVTMMSMMMRMLGSRSQTMAETLRRTAPARA